jgi:hypothetical protein
MWQLGVNTELCPSLRYFSQDVTSVKRTIFCPIPSWYGCLTERPNTPNSKLGMILIITGIISAFVFYMCCTITFFSLCLLKPYCSENKTSTLFEFCLEVHTDTKYLYQFMLVTDYSWWIKPLCKSNISLLFCKCSDFKFYSVYDDRFRMQHKQIILQWQVYNIVTYSGVLFTMELYYTPKSQYTTVKHSQQLLEHT